VAAAPCSGYEDAWIAVTLCLVATGRAAAWQVWFLVLSKMTLLLLLLPPPPSRLLPLSHSQQ
jgi:hypothetical protein